MSGGDDAFWAACALGIFLLLATCEHGVHAECVALIEAGYPECAGEFDRAALSPEEHKG